MCAVSWATWLLFTIVRAEYIALRVRHPGPLGSFSPVRSLGALCCVCRVLGHLAPISPVWSFGALCYVWGVLGNLAPVHRCASSVRCVACSVSLATWLLSTGVPAPFIVLRVRCLNHLAPVHRCARSVRCVACAVSWTTWHLFY